MVYWETSAVSMERILQEEKGPGLKSIKENIFRQKCGIGLQKKNIRSQLHQKIPPRTPEHRN